MKNIDAVILWVDGSDKDHEAKRLAHQKGLDNVSLRDEATSTKRFTDSNEIYYSVHLLRKNANWIRNIFLITDNQKPQWLNIRKQKELNVEVIDHKVIFKGYEKCLPSFNSTSIECMIHRVPGLSSNFIYLNDDFFVVRPVKKTDFFSNGKLIIRGSPYARGLQRVSSYLSYPQWFNYSGLNTYRGIRTQKAFFLFPFVRAHAPYSCNKETLEGVLNSDERMRNAIFKFRDIRQTNPIDMMYNSALKSKNAKIRRRDWAYFSPSMGSGKLLKRILNKCKESSKFKMLCIQEISELNSMDKLRVYDALDNFIKE